MGRKKKASNKQIRKINKVNKPYIQKWLTKGEDITTINLSKKTKSNNNNNKLNPAITMDYLNNMSCCYDAFLVVFTIGLYKKFDDFSLNSVHLFRCIYWTNKHWR